MKKEPPLENGQDASSPVLIKRCKCCHENYDLKKLMKDYGNPYWKNDFCSLKCYIVGARKEVKK